jgi:hypothetical protein
MDETLEAIGWKLLDFAPFSPPNHSAGEIRKLNIYAIRRPEL